MSEDEPTIDDQTADNPPLPKPELDFMTPALDRKDFLLMSILGLGSFILFVWGIWSYGLWDPWEPKYATSVREMFARKDFITPHLYDDPRWTKPILVYWAMAIPVAIFGNNEFTVRLPSVIAATMAVLFIYYFLRKLHSRRAGMMGGAMLATTPQFFYMSRQAMPDMLLTSSLTFCIGFLALALFGDQKRRKRHFGFFYAAVGFAFLAKGPVACVVTLLALFIFWASNLNVNQKISPRSVWPKFLEFLKSYHVLMGVIIFSLVALPWYLMVVIQHGYEYIDSFFRGENIHRFSEAVRGHTGKSAYYVQTMLHGMYPWGGVLMAGAVLYLRKTKEDVQESKLRWLFVSWALGIFIIFTMAGTKIDHYILPITPLIAILAALIWEPYLRKDAPPIMSAVLLASIFFTIIPIRDFLLEGSRYIMDVFTIETSIRQIDVDPFLKVFVAYWALIMVIAVFKNRFVTIPVTILVLYYVFSALRYDEWDSDRPTQVIGVIWGVLCIGTLIKRNAIIMSTLAVLLAFSNGAYFMWYVFPEHAETRSFKEYVEFYHEHKEPHSELVIFGRYRDSMYYYIDKKEANRFADRDARAMVNFVRGKKDVFILVENTFRRSLELYLESGKTKEWKTILSNQKKYMLLSNTKKDIKPVPDYMKYILEQKKQQAKDPDK